MYRPLVSVMMPFYNAADTLRKSVRSVMSLHYRPLEVILVDDGSTDDSGEIALQTAKDCLELLDDKGIDIRFISSENIGVAAARNSALQAARGEYITAVDADDYIEPDALDHYVTATDEGAIDIVAAGVIYEYEARSDKKLFRSDETLTLDEVTIDSLHFLLTNKLIRVSLMSSVDPFIEGQNCWEDLGAISRMLSVGAKVKILPCAWYHYVQATSGSLTKSDPDRILHQHLAVARSLEQWMIERGVSDENAAFLTYLKFIAKVKYLRNPKELRRHPVERLRQWRDTFPEVNRHIMSLRRVPLKYRLLFSTANIFAKLLP